MNILVTGANRGIGFELTSQLLTLGHSIVAGVRSPEKAKELSLLAREYAKNCQVLSLDVNDAKSIEKAATAVNVEHLDIVVNCAGVLFSYDAAISSFDLSELEKTMQTNLYGPVMVTKAFYKLLKKSKSPKLVNITSLMGSIEDNTSGGAYSYRISKAALNMFSKTLALSEPWLNVLMLHPGWVQTDMGGKNALVTPQESAHGLIQQILKTHKSGVFLNFKGEELPW